MFIPKMIRFLAIDGAQRYQFDDASEDKDQSSKPSKFIGKCSGEFSSAGSWLVNKTVTLNQLLKVFKAANAHEHEMTTLKDLPDIHPGKMGKGLLIKNPKGLYNPTKFYMLLENADYAFQNPRWMKYFPAFESSVEAFRDIHFLLGMFYRMHLSKNQKPKDSNKEDKPMPFVPGQLVLVSCEKKWIEQSDARFAYEVRRGFIENVAKVAGTTSHYIYTVYLLDFGFHVEVTAKYLYPLPRPFDSIAPLAVQCSLYGVSPIGAKWSYNVREDFSILLGEYSNHLFIADVLSNYRLVPMFLIVNIDICDFETKIVRGLTKARVKFQVNLTQFLIDSRKGAQWNLFSSRPKLMAGVTPSSPERLYGPRKLNRITVSYRDALLIAPVLIPVVHKRLPFSVVSRELRKLFRLRHHYLVDVLGTTNYLALRIPDPDSIYCTPCTINSTWTNDNEGGDNNDAEETVAIIRMPK